MYRMIALDVDGTLIDDDFQIQPRTKLILQKAHRDGVIITLCTGRNPASTVPLMDELGISGPIVVHNGALCLHSHTEQVYGQIGFQMEELTGLFAFCREEGLHFDVNTAFEIYVERLDERLRKIYESYYVHPVLVSDIREVKEEVVKVSIIGEEPRIEWALKEMQVLFPQFKILRSGENYIDVMHPKVSKGYGLALVCEKLGIPLEQVMAIGNYYNDMDMLAEAGLGIAMENSPDEVKRIADAVTRSNNEEGVYHAVKLYLYGEESFDWSPWDAGGPGAKLDR